MRGILAGAFLACTSPGFNPTKNMVVQDCNPSSLEGEAAGSEVQNHYRI